MSDPQARSEALDDDKLGGEYPPEHPLGIDEETGVDDDQDDQVRDSFAEREARLEPDLVPPIDDEDEPADGREPLLAEDDEIVTPEAAEEAAVHVREDIG